MNTAEYLEQFKSEIEKLNAAHALKTQTLNAWRDYRGELDNKDLADDEKIESLASAMNEASNEYDRLELSLRAKSEKTIGRGKPLGDFWTAISKMQD